MLLIHDLLYHFLVIVFSFLGHLGTRQRAMLMKGTKDTEHGGAQHKVTSNLRHLEYRILRRSPVVSRRPDSSLEGEVPESLFLC